MDPGCDGNRYLDLLHGQLLLPVFLPDATRGVVRSLDSADLRGCGVDGVMMNTFHLMQRPGSTTVHALGGLHRMAGWDRPIVTDSGGFQIYSLIHENPRNGSISNKGLVYRPQGARARINLSPEKSIQLQLRYGADVVYCLDDCTHVDSPFESQQESVRRTVEWSRRGKLEFDRSVEQMGLSDEKRPLLFAVIQGGGSRALRKWCADALLEIGFDGFGYGGWPLDGDGNLLIDVIAYTYELVPSRFPMHALGVGHPANLVESFRAGYTLFDSALPTRDARRGRLYGFREEPSVLNLRDDFFSTVYVQDKKHIKADRPISAHCDCLCCRHYSLGYLHHLFEIHDCLYQRLATIHNLRFMVQLTARLRLEAGQAQVVLPEESNRET
ncbi:MAG: tRNA-guanine transglycosylase [Chloroflexi bacterium]|nr:tRNA-guanine transglycosylase [Chloroflexota bacterium]